MENETGEKSLPTVEEKITYDPNKKTTTTTTTTVNKREDGTAHISERTVIKKQGDQINVAESELVGQNNLEGKEEGFLKAIENKQELAILKTENELMNIINLESFKKILSLMGTNLKDYVYDISLGVYSSEEIYEFRKSLSTKLENKVDVYVKDYDYILETDAKLLLPSFFGEEIFECVENKMNIILEEKKRKKEEEEERLKEEEEQRKKAEEEERLKKEEEERLKKEEEERLKKEEEERKQKEKEEEEKRKKEMEEMQQKEEEEKRKKREEEEERRQK